MTEINAECSMEEEFEMVLEGLVNEKGEDKWEQHFRNIAINIISIPKPPYNYSISNNCYCHER